MKYDAVIIGSGLGGLECAHILSKAGMSVLLLERGTQAGGCLQSYRRHGLAFDTGFHYVGGLDEGQSLHSAFRHLGLLRLPWQRLDNHFDRVTIGNQTFSFAQGYDAFVETLTVAFPAERDALNKYADMLKQCGEQQFDALNPQTGESSVLSRFFETSAYQYLTETFHDPLLINVLCGTSLKMELRKESLPLFTFAHGNGSFIESSWRLKGDGSLIVNSLADGIRMHGGEIICNAEVQELVEKDGKLVHAVCSNGEIYEGNIFISNIHPAVTCNLVKQSSRMKSVADECNTLAERYIPDLRDRITGCYTSTPLTYRNYTLTPEGSAYGLRKDFRNPMITLLSPRTPIPNLLLTGQNLMLHGLHGVTMTALFTCAEVLGKEPIWNIVKN